MRMNICKFPPSLLFDSAGIFVIFGIIFTARNIWKYYIPYIYLYKSWAHVNACMGLNTRQVKQFVNLLV